MVPEPMLLPGSRRSPDMLAPAMTPVMAGNTTINTCAMQRLTTPAGAAGHFLVSQQRNPPTSKNKQWRSHLEEAKALTEAKPQIVAKGGALGAMEAQRQLTARGDKEANGGDNDGDEQRNGDHKVEVCKRGSSNQGHAAEPQKWLVWCGSGTLGRQRKARGGVTCTHTHGCVAWFDRLTAVQSRQWRHT